MIIVLKNFFSSPLPPSLGDLPLVPLNNHVALRERRTSSLSAEGAARLPAPPPDSNPFLVPRPEVIHLPVEECQTDTTSRNDPICSTKIINFTAVTRQGIVSSG